MQEQFTGLVQTGTLEKVLGTKRYSLHDMGNKNCDWEDPGVQGSALGTIFMVRLNRKKAGT